MPCLREPLETDGVVRWVYETRTGNCASSASAGALRKPLFAKRWIQSFAVALLVSGAVTHFAIAKDRVFERSLYADRPLVVRAIKEKNYHLVGERRPDVWKTEGSKRPD